MTLLTTEMPLGVEPEAYTVALTSDPEIDDGLMRVVKGERVLLHASDRGGSSTITASRIGGGLLGRVVQDRWLVAAVLEDGMHCEAMVANLLRNGSRYPTIVLSVLLARGAGSD